MRKLIIYVLVAAALSVGIVIYFWTLPVASLDKAKVEVSVPAEKLMADFEDDESQANALYLGKILEVSGIVKEYIEKEGSNPQLLLQTESIMGDVSCNFDPESIDAMTAAAIAGKSVSVKGECTGYLMDVVLERCVLTE